MFLGIYIYSHLLLDLKPGLSWRQIQSPLKIAVVFLFSGLFYVWHAVFTPNGKK